MQGLLKRTGAFVAHNSLYANRTYHTDDIPMVLMCAL